MSRATRHTPTGAWKFQPLILARIMQARREAKALSLRDVAAVTGVAPATVMRMEQGKRADIDSIVAICEWLEVSVDGFVWKGMRRALADIRDGGERG